MGRGIEEGDHNFPKFNDVLLLTLYMSMSMVDWPFPLRYVVRGNLPMTTHC